MPFCEDCARYWAPTAMNPDGSCPACGRVIDTLGPDPVPNGPTSGRRVDVKALAAAGGVDQVSAPWHFKLLVTALVVYLGWRIVDLFV